MRQSTLEFFSGYRLQSKVNLLCAPVQELLVIQTTFNTKYANENLNNTEYV